MRRHGVMFVLPNPFLSRAVALSVVVSVMGGRADGMNSSCAILEFVGSEKLVLDVLKRMTVMSPL